MAKKTNKQQNSAAGTVEKKPLQARPVAKGHANERSPENGFIGRYANILLPAAIALITWLFLQVCLDNQLTNWDDPGYVKDNALIKDISAEGIRNIFSTAIMGNYHPLTILSYAIEYSFVRLQPMLYHLDSVLFHILVTLLAYWFVLLLTKRRVAAAVAALLFGLHPMHVESIAWIAGRKDVLYGAFYLAACIAHVKYMRSAEGEGKGWYIIVAALFLCSLLAKPVAVVLPVTLLLIDYFEGRKLNFKLLVEKIPLFLISIGFGIKSVMDQKSFGSLDTLNVTFNPVERMGLGGYALVTYLWKALIPVHLCCYYPYPDKAGGALPFVYYLYPIGIIVVLFLLWKFARRNKVVVFGALFFLINILLLLQFIPVGGAILADRYSYIPYLGLFFIAGWYVSGFFEPGAKKETGYIVAGITLVYSLCLGYLSHERSKVWYDTTSLWSDEIVKESDHAPNAYNNLGFNYFNKYSEAVNAEDKKRYYDSAMQLLQRAIELQPTFVNPYISVGELLRSSGHFAEAKTYYYRALSIKSFDQDANAYLGLGIIYAINHNYDSSAYCFRTALQLKPHFPEAHSNYGNFLDMTGKTDSALVQYGLAIEQNPDMYAPHLNRGRALQRLKRCGEAMKDFEAALQLNPDNGEIYYARAYCHAQNGNKAMAVQDIDRAISLGFRQIDKNFYQAMKGR
jgi:protein O-mannosyl-transferase